MQMGMLGFRKKAEGGVGGEGAVPPPQSSMSIAILTCIAINCMCMRMCVTKRHEGSPLKLAPWGQTPPFIDTEWGALKKAYEMDGHQEFVWIQNGRAQSEP